MVANNHLFKFNNRSSGKRCQICSSKLTVKKDTRTTSRHRFGVFIVNLEHISHLFSGVSIVDFEQVNVCRVVIKDTLKIKNSVLNLFQVDIQVNTDF